jgi:hypothetical protein
MMENATKQHGKAMEINNDLIPNVMTHDQSHG